MYLTADSVKVDDDEGRFRLEMETEEGLVYVDIHGIDLDAFYDSVKGRVGPYLHERDEALRSRPRAFYDQSEAYEPDDPKHPAFHSVHADLYDTFREGK